MQKLEEGMENMLKLQRESKEEFKTFKDETVQRVTECVAAINTHTAQAKKDKKDTDNKLAQFRKSLALFDSMMAHNPNKNRNPHREKSPDQPSLQKANTCEPRKTMTTIAMQHSVPKTKRPRATTK
jgi:hypothetical protein